MRICRIDHNGSPAAAFYCDTHVVPIIAAAEAYAAKTGQRIDLPAGDDLLAFLPPDGSAHQAAATLSQWVDEQADDLPGELRRPVDDVQLLVPVPRPNKLLLLAGNYAEHIEESGGIAAARAETFPYVFMKPASTTLTDPGRPVPIPEVSPNCIDWELELAVVIGRVAKGVKEADALDYVAGYTIINDISDRRFFPNSDRTDRDKDAFFDWLHGKWHDGFCPCGPCVVSAADVPDPQTLEMRLTVNGEVKQQATTAQQIFPVAAVIEFISSFVTLEPGDLISTGTPAGIGATKNTYLRAGDVLEATISEIGTLTSPVT
ncbi:MAG: fumarylacetoacetate hydrolase family protein [Planctomycetes bacterium]|nr:fumarylacetoacetate hydrolase family protein [Planctomycetota bacterium]